MAPTQVPMQVLNMGEVLDKVALTGKVVFRWAGGWQRSFQLEGPCFKRELQPPLVPLCMSIDKMLDMIDL